MDALIKKHTKISKKLSQIKKLAINCECSSSIDSVLECPERITIELFPNFKNIEKFLFQCDKIKGVSTNYKPNRIYVWFYFDEI